MKETIDANIIFNIAAQRTLAKFQRYAQTNITMAYPLINEEVLFNVFKM